MISPQIGRSDDSKDARSPPAWFVALVHPEKTSVSVPISIRGKPQALVITSHPDDEMSEIWDGIVTQLEVGSAIAVALFLITMTVVGRALAPLAARGFLVIASGNVTHNLRDYQLAARNGGQTFGYVRQFADWMAERLQAHDTDALLDYRARAPGAVQAHPSDEHLLPLFVALGAAGERAEVQRFHAGIDDYVIAMDAYSFLPHQGGRP
jgi:hypothetical protein